MAEELNNKQENINKIQRGAEGRNYRKNTKSINRKNKKEDTEIGNINENRENQNIEGIIKGRNRRTRNNTNKNNTKSIIKKSNLKIIPLGGLHEIGKNITVFEYEDEIIVVDCGLSFPEDDMLGIDLVIPDITYLERNVDKIKE